MSKAEMCFNVYNDNSVHTSLELFSPVDAQVSQHQLLQGILEQYIMYKSYATTFIEAAALQSVDGSSVGMLEHYKTGTDFQSLIDPAVYPESTEVLAAMEKVSVCDDWMICEGVAALSSSKLLQTLKKDDIIHIDVLEINPDVFESVYSETQIIYSKFVNDSKHLLNACTFFKLSDCTKLIIVGSWQSLPDHLDLTKMIISEKGKEADQAPKRQAKLFKVVTFI